MRKLLLCAVCLVTMPLLVNFDNGPAVQNSSLVLNASESRSETKNLLNDEVKPVILEVNNDRIPNQSEKISRLDVPVKQTKSVDGGKGLESNARIKENIEASSQVLLHYPKEMYKRNVEARIIVTAVINEKGEATKVSYNQKESQITNGPNNSEYLQQFGEAAVQAVGQTEFEPARLKDGTSVPSQIVLPVQFKMPKTDVKKIDKLNKSKKMYPSGK